MRRPGLTEPIRPSLTPLAASPTPLAKALHLFAFRPPAIHSPKPSSSDWGWPTDLPGLNWAQQHGKLKPSVEVLATASSNDTAMQAPLVTRLRYGAGQAVYVATDDLWRWRFGRGDVYYQQFWIQLVRMLGRHRVHGSPPDLQLTTSHSRVELGQPVVIELSVGDAMVLQRQLPRIPLAATQPENTQGQPAWKLLEQIDLIRTQPPTPPSADSGGSQQSQQLYRAIWKPQHTGQLTLRAQDPGLAMTGLSRTIEVIDPNDERRHPIPDHARLETLAHRSGGKVVPLDRLQDLVHLVPNRTRRTPNDLQESLWDSPMTILIVMLLLTLEWVGRKLIQLV